MDERFLIKVYGTDIDRKSLKSAQGAEYRKEAVKNVSAKDLKRYFEFIGGKYQVKKEIRDLVEFRYHDLITAPCLKNIDVILCRNVFIYFTRSLQEQLIMKFYNSLIKDGYLVMGKVESLIA